MTSALVRCDGAPRPGSGMWDTEISIRHRGERAELNLSLTMPGEGLLPRFDERSKDLVRIASYVLGADQQVSRGGEADAIGKNWKREFTLCVPVADRIFWASTEVVSDLQSLLGWVSDDVWHFEFSQVEPEDAEAEMLNIDPSEALGKPDCVVLFSGGLDSLTSVVEKACVEGRRPLLVSHAPMFNLRGWQGVLLDELRRSYRDWHFPRVGCAIHRRESRDPHETTLRSRPFLHASLGAAIAHAAGVREVFLADNGPVSLNLPVNDQLLGARASRSTHPRFLREFEAFANRLWPKKLRVTNPLWSRTRRETLSILETTAMLPLINLTHSCASSRFRTRAQPHCGVCSQCIDRRFATLDAGYSEYDGGERYEVDVFLDALKEGDARTMALSYVRHATELSELPAEQLFSRFPQLFDCVPAGPEQAAIAGALPAMLRRHGEGVVRVMANQIALAREPLARGKLPPTCLLALVASQTRQPLVASDNKFRHSPDYRQVWIAGKKLTLTVNQSRVIQLLDGYRLDGDLAVSQDHILEKLDIGSKKLAQVFRTLPEWRELITRDPGGVFRLNA